jgi:diacylglycerol kinase (ATP)
VGPQDVLVIVNPVAGRGAALETWRRVETPLAGLFPEHAVRITTARGDAERWAAEWGQQRTGGTVIAVGGDGTVHDVVNGLLHRGVPARLGVIPSGTGNDFARNTGVPTPVAAALERLQQGRPIPVDAGRIRFEGPNGSPGTRVFVNSVSLGVSPRANRIAGSIRRVLPGRICYAVGGVLALLAERAGRYTIASGDRTLFSGRALNITLANGASFGGGMRISPASSPSDGVLDQVVIGNIGRVSALVALSRLYTGTHVGMRGIAVGPIPAEVQIARADGPMLVETDGEDVEAVGVVSIAVLPGAIHLL